MWLVHEDSLPLIVGCMLKDADGDKVVKVILWRNLFYIKM